MTKPTTAKPNEQVWVVTCHSDAGDHSDDAKLPLHKRVTSQVLAVCRSKEAARATAVRAMEARKAELGSKVTFEDLAKKSLTPSEELVCGFGAKPAEGTEGSTGMW